MPKKLLKAVIYGPRWTRFDCPLGEQGGVVVIQTCRDAILQAFEDLERAYGRRDFEFQEVVREVTSKGQFRESTVRTHIVSLMCVQAPPNHATRYPDLDRVARGRYRRR